MKVQKMITLDHEISLKLHEERNASMLINDLLKAHYGTGKLSKEMVEMGIVVSEKKIADEKDTIVRAKVTLKELNKPRSFEDRVRF